MLTPPFLENEEQRLEVLADPHPSSLPRDERFDRVTRTAMRLLEVPVAFLAVAGEDGLALRSVQGVQPHQTSHAMAFCDPQLLSGQALLVPDASANPLFWHNPLVCGPARLRSFVAVPLLPSPGVRGGVLCALHTEARALRHGHVLALQDLARLVEAELRLEALALMHKRVVARLAQLERRGHFDTVTGCWNVRRFRELLAMAVADAHARGTTLALCYVRARNFKALALDKAEQDVLRQRIAQELRQRLPARGALASLGGADFCALLPADSPALASAALGEFCQPGLESAGLEGTVQLAFGRSALHELGCAASATEVWARALSQLEH